MKNEFDNSLTDKGWQSMHRLLDREMPEERRRRRFIWWWAALLLLPLAGAGLWLLSQPTTPEMTVPTLVAPKVPEPVAGKNETLQAVVDEAIDNKKHSLIPGDKHRTFVESRPENVVGGESVVDGNANNGQSGYNLISSEASHAESPEAKDKNQFSSNGLKIQDENTASALYESLTPLPVPLQLIENEKKIDITKPLVNAFEPETVKKQTAPRRWSIGVTTGLASENFSRLNGFSAGAAVDWKFARKWGLRSGLQYAQYRLSDEARPVVSLDVNSYSEATDNSISFTGSPNTNPYFDPSVLVPVEQLKQLEMPFLAWWQPVRPLRLFGGFTTTYNLSAQASQQNYSNNQFYYANTKVAQDNLNELTSNTLSRWQMNWQVGAGVRIGRHFELDAFYKQGFSKTTSAQFDADPNSLYDQQWQPRSAGAAHYFLLNGIWFF